MNDCLLKKIIPNDRLKQMLMLEPRPENPCTIAFAETKQTIANKKL